MIKIGLKANAAFLFGEMKGDTLGGAEGSPYWRFVLHVTERQFRKFRLLIIAFGGDLEKSLIKTAFTNYVDYECYFVKLEMKVGGNIPKTLIALCKQDGRVAEICNEGEDDNRPNNYWLTLVEGWHWCDCGSVHEHTVADCKQALRDVQRV